jgi:hypothetical protein
LWTQSATSQVAWNRPQGAPISAKDIEAGFKRLDRLPLSADGLIHFQRLRAGVRVTSVTGRREEIAAYLGLLWLSGHKAKDVLRLHKNHLVVEGDAIVITWPEGGVGRYPQDQYVSESMSRVLAHTSTLEEGAPLFKGRSKRYGVNGINDMGGYHALGVCWLWLQAIYPGWSNGRIRQSACLRIFIEGGVPLVNERCGHHAKSVFSLYWNRFIREHYQAEQLRLRPKPIYVKVESTV